MKKAAIISILGLAVVGMSSAQSRSSFSTPASWTGIDITSTGPKSWNLALSGAPTITWQGQTYEVLDVFGFWLLDNDNDMSAKGQSFGVWTYNQNYSGTGGIAGYKTNPNKGVERGESQTYTFKEVNGNVDGFGIHVRVSLDDCIETFYFEQPAPVPEPASLAAIGVGVAAFARRRRKR